MHRAARIRFLGRSLASSLVSIAGLAACSLRSRFKRPVPGDYARIAVVQTGHLGDLVLTLPIISSLRKMHPEAKITFIVGEWGREAAESFAPEAEVVSYYPRKYRRGNVVIAPAPSMLEYDLIIHLRGDFKLVARYFLNIKAVFLYGLARGNLRRSFLFHAGISEMRVVPEHQYQTFRNMMLKIGVILPERPEIDIKKEWADSLSGLLDERWLASGKIAVLHPGAPWDQRRWPAERFRLAGEALAEGGFRVFVIGAPSESGLSEYFGEGFVDLIGKLDLRQLAALLASCEIYIGNDSGPAHLAAAAGAAVIVMYGPQETEVFGALAWHRIWLDAKRPCSPCWQRSCVLEYEGCLSSISVADAAHALEMLLLRKTECA